MSHTKDLFGYGEDNDGWYIEQGGEQVAHGLSETLARRIVAYMNACDGIGAESLDLVSAPTLAASVVSGIEKQRDDALNAKAQYQTLLADMTERCHEAEKQRVELQAKVDGLTVDLADSRANDIAAMRWLADCRFAVGDDGKRMLPEFVDYLKEIVKQRDELLALIKKIKEWDISDFALAIPVGLREEMQRLICEAKGGA